MPELPDIEAYLEALRPRVLGHSLLGVRLASPFLLRTVDPPLGALAGRRVGGITRLGKRIVFELGSAADSPPLLLVLHLMVAGRLHWKPPGAAIPRGSGVAAFDFATGTLILTEAGKKHRASLHVLEGRETLAVMDPGGLEVLGSSPAAFGEALRRENHTLKRALTDPAIVSGIGNAYSDEILHRARLSPFKQTRALDESEIRRLHEAAVAVLSEWTERLRAAAREMFPEKVTAFRPDMAVHGRFGAPCPVCGTAIRRIVYSENECDYCPVCQTEGRILADRSLSRLLRDDWPRNVEEMIRPPGAEKQGRRV
jgi:formamidopyrimidine-DNA glycosylase